MASELPASTLSTAGGGAPAETVPESSAVDSSQMGKPGRHVVVKRNFRPESDPQFSCCIKLNLHLSVIVISSIMLPLCVGVTAYYVVTSLAKLRTFNPRVLDDFGAAFMMIMSYGCLLVGSVWRIEKLYWAYAIFSALFLIITFCAMGDSIAHACSLLLGDLRVHTTETGQENNTSAGQEYLEYVMVLCFITSVHFYLFYIVWRDYKFVKEYPRKKKVVENTESEKLLN